jgi:hypothetical protein
VEVGQALLEIREKGLYQQGTFEEYCRERWGFARQTAYDYLKAAEVAENVRTCVQDMAGPSLSQARELAVLSPEQQREAWDAAVKASPNGQPTAAQVSQACAVYGELQSLSALITGRDE